MPISLKDFRNELMQGLKDSVLYEESLKETDPKKYVELRDKYVYRKSAVWQSASSTKPQTKKMANHTSGIPLVRFLNE